MNNKIILILIAFGWLGLLVVASYAPPMPPPPPPGVTTLPPPTSPPPTSPPPTSPPPTSPPPTSPPGVTTTTIPASFIISPPNYDIDGVIGQTATRAVTIEVLERKTWQTYTWEAENYPAGMEPAAGQAP